MYICRLLIIIVLVIVHPPQSYAQKNNISASPGPSNGNNLAPGPIGPNVEESCSMVSRSCKLKHITACLPYPQIGHQDLLLLVQNNDKNVSNVTIGVLPTNTTIKAIELQSYQTEKINVSSYIGNGLSSSIAINTGEDNCIIRTEAPAPENNNYYRKFTSSDTYVKCGYLVILLVIIVGGILACFKLSRRNRTRHVDGIAYHEIELGNSTALSSLNNMEQEEDQEQGWDQYWDDEWDEEKTVKSHAKNHEDGKLGNGLTKESLD